MSRVARALVCLVCACNGRRMQNTPVGAGKKTHRFADMTHKQLVAQPSEPVQGKVISDSLKTLSTLLVALDPAAAAKTPQPKPPSFFQKYIAPNIFNFYPLASAIALVVNACQNDWSFDKTMTNGGDQAIFNICVKTCMIHNGLAHLFMTPIVHKSQGLQMTPGSLMFENELGAVCLSMGIVSLLPGSSDGLASLAKTNGLFFMFAAIRHILHNQPVGTCVGGFLTGFFQLLAGFHEQPL